MSRAGMRIAVFHNLPSGGAKRALYNLVKCLAKAGYTFDAFLPSTADENFCPLRDIVSGYRIFPVRRTTFATTAFALRRSLELGRQLMEQERTQKRIAEAINNGPYDVVLSEQDYCTLSPFVLKFLAGPSLYYCQQPNRSQEAFVQVVADSGAGRRPANWYRRKREDFRVTQSVEHDKQNASFASYIVTNSYFSRENVLRAYGKNAFVSYLGTDVDLFRPLSLPRENYVLSVGSCIIQKGYDFLIRSLSLIDARIRPSLLLVSNMKDASWEAYLRRLAAKLSVELITREGVSDSDLVHLYNGAKLLVYAPYLEPFGLAPLEAMACGTPVIAVKEGGVRESVLHNETGILTERDEEAFALATTELLRDDGQRERMGSRGLEVVRNFWTWTHAAERLGVHLTRAAGLPRRQA